MTNETYVTLVTDLDIELMKKKGYIEFKDKGAKIRLKYLKNLTKEDINGRKRR